MALGLSTLMAVHIFKVSQNHCQHHQVGCNVMTVLVRFGVLLKRATSADVPSCS